MKNYKELKSANKNSVARVKFVTFAKVDEVKYKDGDDIPDGAKVGDIKIHAQDEESREELQLTTKKYNPETGASLDDEVTVLDLGFVKGKVDSCKSQISDIETQQSEWEQLEKDLKAL